MASAHVLERREGRVRIVLHFAVPSGNNAAGIPWSTALVNSGLVTSSRLLAGDGIAGTISAAEQASLAAGALYEVVEEVKLLSAGSTANQLNAFIDTHWNRRRTEVLAELQRTLNYFGRTRDVP